MSGRFDLAVIGAGSAGFSAAITAAGLGARVALVGDGTIGGTCVNVGCVPSKTMIRAAETLHQAGAASRFAGIEAGARVTDWKALVGQTAELVVALRQAKYTDLLPAYDSIAYLEGRAALTQEGPRVDGGPLDAGRVVIATGASPSVPDIDGIADVPYLTSTTALELETLPKSMTVIGGGYIGCELAQMFARAGVAVTVVFRSRLLPEAEPEISDALAGYFRAEGIGVRGGVGYRKAAVGADGVELHVVEDGEEAVIASEKLLVTTGRRANTAGMGLQESGVELRPDGAIKVDDRMRTTRPGVYAAGDVTGRDPFVYMAAYGAKLAALNALDGDAERYDNRAMPAVVFTDPQAASVGLTEAAARAQGINVKTALIDLEQVPRALAARDTRGLIKLVADAVSDELVGAHILAPEGADSIQTAALAIQQRLSARALGEMVFPYLTTVEGLKLAALAFDKDVSMLSCCAG